MVTETNRKAIVQGFDGTMTIGERNIGTGVTAFDKPDGSTIIICIHEAIDHTTQDNTIVSLNQIRHHGVDVCDVHPKFDTNGQARQLKIRVGNHELPFTMVNGLAALFLDFLLMKN